MKRVIYLSLLMLLAASFSGNAGVFERVPRSWKWISPTEAVFSYDGSYVDAGAFSMDTGFSRRDGVKAPGRFAAFPIVPEGAENLTWSPDSSKLAFTRKGDLFVLDVETLEERRLTSDGSDVISNGYASWVYYEEIFGRPSRYRAFWWSPDSRKIGFYRFDNSSVPMFPIYSPFGQDGSIRETRYPKAGEKNPEVKIGIADLSQDGKVVWAGFDVEEDQYFGTPFWDPSGERFFVSREPRLQHDLELFSVAAADGSAKLIYSEHCDTWLDWMDDALFTTKGLYIARSFETGWQQIYFLSYDGKEFKRISDGPNWRISLIRADENTGDVFFTACRDCSYRTVLYRLTRKGEISALTDTSLSVSDVVFSPDGSHFVCSLSGFSTPTQVWMCRTSTAGTAWKARRLSESRSGRKYTNLRAASSSFKVADARGEEFDADSFSLPEIITMTLGDGTELPGYVYYPVDFDPAGKYPVRMEIYGGPHNATVRDRWIQPSEVNQWWGRNGIINVLVDCRAAGHHGRADEDLVFRNLTEVPVSDFCDWAKYLGTLPYVDASRIGVEGFSFGGTMTAMLVLTHPELFCCGIAGGGVYDWTLYDSHYTERFMETPRVNPDGYAASSVLRAAEKLPYGMRSNLMLTHGTGDDNVHFQNTLQLVNVLQTRGVLFDLMVYPDGMHGYSGAQRKHCEAMCFDFWKRHLLPE